MLFIWTKVKLANNCELMCEIIIQKLGNSYFSDMLLIL